MQNVKAQIQPSAFTAFQRYERGESPFATVIDQDNHGYGQYLFGPSYVDPTLGGEDAIAANWSSYTASRIGVRLWSRGLLGATLYTLAHRWIPGQLQGYKAVGAIDKGKPLQYLARGFDIMYGKPIQAYVRQYYKWKGKTPEQIEQLATQATTFRLKRDFAIPGQEQIMGRSLGAEIVGMTTDFAAGSTGDAWGRQIANMFDPNHHNVWEREDGSTDWGVFSKAVAQNAWKIFSLNQGEDWIAALPYVYQMRFQRQGIDKLYRGFGMSSDHQFNGGSWRKNHKQQIVGSYAKAGALDLQLRFTGYNVYTLMYRDFYEMVSDAFRDYRDKGTLPSPSFDSGDPIHNVLDSVADLVRYAAKSTIKATIYMTPAVPFFWVTRTPQTKAHGLSISVDELTGSVSPVLEAGPVEPFAVRNTRGVFDRILNPFGEACYKTSKRINRIAKALGASEASTAMGYDSMGKRLRKTFAEDFVNSSASYTPYMIAKAETALRWDRPKDKEGMNDMDRAIYQFIDGVAGFNLGKVKAGLGGIREEMIYPDSHREIEERVRTQTIEEMQKERQKAELETPDNQVTQVTSKSFMAKSAHARETDRDWQRKMEQARFMKEVTPTVDTRIH